MAETAKLKSILDEQKAQKEEQKLMRFIESKAPYVTNMGPPDHKELIDF